MGWQVFIIVSIFSVLKKLIEQEPNRYGEIYYRSFYWMNV